MHFQPVVTGQIITLMMVANLAMVGQGFSAQPAPAAPPTEPSPTQTAVLTLQTAIELAKAGNPQLRASEGRVMAAEGRAWQAGRWSNPELELEVEDWPVSNGGEFSDAKQTIGVAQTLPWPGKKKLDRQIGGVGVRLGEAGRQLRLVEVVRNVKAAFFGVLAAERSLEAGEALLRVTESSAETAHRRVEAGAAPFQEELRADIQLEQARMEVANLRRKTATARLMLVTLLGRPDLKEVPVRGAMAEEIDQRLLQAFDQDWLSVHPSMLAAEADLSQAELELRRARLEPYPDVRAGASGGRVGESDESIIQFALSIPLPLLDSGKGLKSEAAANVSVAEAQRREVRLELEREKADALRRYHVALDQVASYRERIVPKSAEALRLVQTGFEEGKFGFMDLLDTQRTFAETRLAYQQKLLELNVAQAELEALLPATPGTNQPTPTSTH